MACFVGRWLLEQVKVKTDGRIFDKKHCIIMNVISQISQWYLVEKGRKKNIKQWKTYLRENGFPVNMTCPEEKVYIQFWKQLSPQVEPYSFRFYSHFMGKVHYIIPEDIGHRVIENYLNPKRFRDFYNDKNVYTQLFAPQLVTPKTLLCRINGSPLLDGNYQIAKTTENTIGFNSTSEELAAFIGDYDSIIIKPTIDTKGGQGILKFEKNGNLYQSCDNHIPLTGASLQSFGNDFCVQESIKQHPFLAQFNPTSVNTMRVCTYRSVVDEEVVFFACALRMGSKGSFTDNTHSGGAIVKVDLETGKIGNVVYGKYRKPYSTWNDIDFNSFEGFVPNWENVIKFAKNVAAQIHHLRLLSLDITIRNNGEPILIELNANGFSFGLPMCLNQPVFGDRFDEVIEYCKKRRNSDCTKQ